MATIHWIDDDAGYEGWLSAHPHGFMANLNKPPGGLYFRIHRATHALPDRSKPNSVNPRMGHGYSKLTAETVAELIAWAKLNLPTLKEFGKPNYCKTCSPRG